VVDVATGLRERKKQRTRATITRVALELFARNGFAATTVNEIAEAAEVSPRTVSTYFPTKEGIVFAEYRASIERLAACLERREPGETVIDALCRWLIAEESAQAGPGRALVGRADDDDADVARLREIAIERDQDLWGMQRRETRVMRGMIGDAWAEEIGVPADSLAARTIGATAVSALLELNAYAARNDSSATDSLPTILAFLRGGVAALQADAR
jgi:AcrR family transcriptional regulator